MRLIVNGLEKEFEDGINVEGLLAALDLQAARVAIELNRKILQRAEWPAARFQEGDQLEIVQLVGGG